MNKHHRILNKVHYTLIITNMVSCLDCAAFDLLKAKYNEKLCRQLQVNDFNCLGYWKQLKK